MDPVYVRGAESGDLPSLTDLYNHYVRISPATFDLEPASLESRRQWMSRFADTGPHRLLVAIDRGTIAGYATSGRLREKPGYLPSVETTVYVHPDHYARGIGTRLYQALFTCLEGEDVHRAYAAIVVPNAASIALHARFGFVSIGMFREVGRKFDRYWDVEWFERPLP